MVKHQGPRFAEPPIHARNVFKKEETYSWFVFGLIAFAIVLVFGISLLIAA
jgi:hypothetical protein